MPAETGARSPNCWWTRSSSLRILTKIDKAGRRYYTIRAIDKQFTPARLRPGYKVEQIDAFLDEAEQRLAAMRSDVVRRALKRYVARS
jgi:DNA-binding transcriptional MerR regulator